MCDNTANIWSSGMFIDDEFLEIGIIQLPIRAMSKSSTQKSGASNSSKFELQSIIAISIFAICVAFYSRFYGIFSAMTFRASSFR
jgi:hypothetical protein